ncbi:FAD-binding protein [bacterium]|nr:FAD-binding protein [bacterium]
MSAIKELEVGGQRLPVQEFQAVIIGSGAAGLNCAEHLHELGVTDIALLTSRLGSGTSANSGSDKQTYYKMGVFGDVADSPMEFAQSLVAGGMCHGDMAYVEGLGSLPEFFHLVRNGVGFPHNRYGAYVGYKTDHDPRQRATSAGPKTSMQMVEKSLAKVRRKGTPIFDGFEAIRLLTAPVGSDPTARRIVGVLALDRSRLAEKSTGLVVFLAPQVVLATGGPGELYKTSVYPPGQVGSHGLALEVGCQASNLTESQFGLASTGFRWNLSGTYQQVIPCYFSTDTAGGDVRYFLNDYFQSMRQEATNIFLKGYQWPFHAERLLDYGSSLVDIAVFNETRAGRKVYMDFLRNPVSGGNLEEFSLENLEPEARVYLERSGALQATPYERLEHMNPAAIEIYTEHGVDLHEPLEVAVCSQHCNGGLTVDLWWRTKVDGLFAIGEVAGTHGVRPGGSALNAGQVGGLRVAQYIAHQQSTGKTGELPSPEEVRAQIEAEREEIGRYLKAGADAPNVGEVRREIQERMTEYASQVRSREGVEKALREAEVLCERIATVGQKLHRREQLVAALENEHLCRTHLAFLTALQNLIERGGGSRGAYVVLDEEGDRVVATPKGESLRHRSENLPMRQEVLEVHAEDGRHFKALVTPVRPLPEDDSWYETTWREWREGTVFD